MFVVSDAHNIFMSEGDYGVALPFTFSGISIAPQDELKLTIMDPKDDTTIIEKTFIPERKPINGLIQNNSFNLELTLSETGLLKPGSYVYLIDWYQEGHFLCNLLPATRWVVMGKK